MPLESKISRPLFLPSVSVSYNNLFIKQVLSFSFDLQAPTVSFRSLVLIPGNCDLPRINSMADFLLLPLTIFVNRFVLVYFWISSKAGDIINPAIPPSSSLSSSWQVAISNDHASAKSVVALIFARISSLALSVAQLSNWEIASAASIVSAFSVNSSIKFVKFP